MRGRAEPRTAAPSVAPCASRCPPPGPRRPPRPEPVRRNPCRTSCPRRYGCHHARTTVRWQRFAQSRHSSLCTAMGPVSQRNREVVSPCSPAEKRGAQRPGEVTPGRDVDRHAQVLLERGHKGAVSRGGSLENDILTQRASSHHLGKIVVPDRVQHGGGQGTRGTSPPRASHRGPSPCRRCSGHW